MLFSKKLKGYCAEFGEQSTLVARLSQLDAPLVVEELKEFPASEPESLRAWVAAAEGKGPMGHVHACCGIYPAKRLVRRHTLDTKRAKEPTYFNELYSQQFRIEPDKYTLMILNSEDGSEFDGGKSSQKEVLFCGLPSDDILSTQDNLLEQGVYPERLELGTVALLGGLAGYLKFTQSRTPVLLLEMGDESTQSYILSADGVDISRPITSGTAAMIPLVQKELGLKDEDSARKLFFSNTFDFTSMGGSLIRKLLKELQSSIGFYEVQTGQSIGHVLCTQLPPALGWIGTTIASSLGVAPFKADLGPWLESLSITVPQGVAPGPLDERWLGLFSLIANHQNVVAATAAGEKG
jgi:hypothetical protein